VILRQSLCDLVALQRVKLTGEPVKWRLARRVWNNAIPGVRCVADVWSAALMHERMFCGYRELHLDCNDFSGPLPDSIGRLPLLRCRTSCVLCAVAWPVCQGCVCVSYCCRALSLNNNKFSGGVPASYGHLELLTCVTQCPCDYPCCQNGLYFTQSVKVGQESAPREYPRVVCRAPVHHVRVHDRLVVHVADSRCPSLYPMPVGVCT
jgi:hypothetical protein